MKQDARAAFSATLVGDAYEIQGNVVALLAQRPMLRQPHPKELLERVYAAGSLPVAPDDLTTKIAVAGLAAFGFLVVEEVLTNGTTRKLHPGKALPGANPSRPWRISKPAFVGGGIGVPDIVGVVIRFRGDDA